MISSPLAKERVPPARRGRVAKLRIKWTKSAIGYKPDNRETLRSLGLRRMQQVIEHDDNPVIRGMLVKVRHLVDVEVIS